jgi:hypothetical protein
MRILPKRPWPIRLAALVMAAGLSLYVPEIYAFGARFVAAVGSVTTQASRPSAAAPRKGEPGVVTVNILPERKPAR